MTKERKDVLKMEDNYDDSNGYEFGHLFLSDGKFTNDCIKNECEKIGVNFDERGLSELEEKIKKLRDDMSENSEEVKDLIHVYIDLYVKILRDKSNIKENMALVEYEIGLYYVIGTYENSLILFTNLEICMGLLSSESKKNIPGPSEVFKQLEEYKGIYSYHNENTKGDHFVYMDGVITPFSSDQLNVETKDKISVFINSKN